MSPVRESAGAPAGTGPRRAALLLHAMSVADRQWILDTLDPAQRLSLEVMLEELRSLGIVPAPAFVEALVSSSESEAAATFRPQDVDADVIADVLRNEPDALIARVLAPAPAAWCRAVIDEFEAPRRNALRACVSERPAAARTSRCRLDEEISRRLQAGAHARGEAVVARRTRWSALTRRLRRGSAMCIAALPAAGAAS